MATYYVKTTGNDSTGDGSSGNPWATPGRAGSALGVDDILYIEEGTYTLTTSTANVAGGRLVLPTNLACTVIGHATAGITDFSARPTISAGSVTGISIITLVGSDGENQTVFNVIVNGNKGTNNTGFSSTLGNFRAEYIVNCEARECASRGFNSLSCFFCKSLYTTTRTGTGFSGCNVSYCHSDHHAEGYQGNGLQFNNCIASNCTDGWQVSNSYRNRYQNCVAYNSTNSGFASRNAAALSGGVYINCIAYGNGARGWLFNVVSGSGLINCASGANTSGRTDGNEAFDLGAIALTADPFIDAPNGNFELNDTAGGGALLRSLGFGIPGQTQNVDIGAVQHACPTGGASAYGYFG